MKFMQILLVLGILSLNAQVLNVTKNWNLFGAVLKIDDLSPFDDECVKSVFVYKDNNWVIYSKGDLESIDEGVGFWVYAGDDCSITLPIPAPPTNTSPQPTAEQIKNIKRK